MKSIAFNLKLVPAAEKEFVKSGKDQLNCSKKERIQAFSIHLLRFVFIAILLYSVVSI